jgi:glycosyltransferase involved in cell wall biosynthesis
MVLHHCEPPYGGPEVQALRLAVRLMSRGHRVLVIAKGSGNYPAFEKRDGVPIYRLNHPGLASLEVLYRLYALRNSFDIIHVHSAGRLAASAIRFAHAFNKKIFVKVTMNGGIVKAVKPGPLGFIKRVSPFRNSKVELLKQADSMIAITQDIVKDLRQYAFPEEKIAYIPNGVDTSLFYPPSDEEKRALRARLNLPQDKTLFIFTGKITKRKGIDVLLTAWLKASEAHQQAVLVIIGSGVGQKDSLEQYAHSFIVENNLKDSVLMVGAVDNVEDFLKAADVFVFPSRWEGLPNSLLEAMAASLFCIASNIEGVNELIIPGKTGVLTPVGDAAALVQALDQAHKSRSLSLAAEAAAVIQREFSIEATTQKLEQLFMRK